jgi:hypothetical protein
MIDVLLKVRVEFVSIFSKLIGSEMLDCKL